MALLRYYLHISAATIYQNKAGSVVRRVRALDLCPSEAGRVSNRQQAPQKCQKEATKERRGQILGFNCGGPQKCASEKRWHREERERRRRKTKERGFVFPSSDQFTVGKKDLFPPFFVLFILFYFMALDGITARGAQENTLVVPVSQRKRQLKSVPPAAGTERSREMRTTGRDEIPRSWRRSEEIQFSKFDDQQLLSECDPPQFCST